MSEKKLNEIIYYSDYFLKKDFKKDILKLYQEHIKYYIRVNDLKFARNILKNLVSKYFLENENIKLDFRVMSVKLFLKDLENTIIEDMKNEEIR